MASPQLVSNIFRQKHPFLGGVAVVTSWCLRRAGNYYAWQHCVTLFVRRLSYLMVGVRGWRNTLPTGRNILSTLPSSFTACAHSIGTCRLGLQDCT